MADLGVKRKVRDGQKAEMSQMLKQVEEKLANYERSKPVLCFALSLKF